MGLIEIWSAPVSWRNSATVNAWRTSTGATARGLSHERLGAQDRGNAAHDRFYKDSLAIARESERKGRCFVATLALGECAETDA